MENLNESSDVRLKGGDINTNEDKGISKKIVYIIIGAAVVLLLIFWIWKNAAVKNEQERAEQQKQEILTSARTMISSSHKEHLKLLAKPYVWALRTELLKGNVAEVNNYANEMVKEKNFQSIVVANDKGIIISSTNKKNEGMEFKTVGDPAYLQSNNTTVESVNDSIIVMTSPIMGFNNKLGTLMISYKAKNPL